MYGAKGGTAISLVWAAPSSFGKEHDGATDATIKRYDIFYQKGSTVDYFAATKLITQTAAQLTISSLDRATEYTFALRSINSADMFSDSNTITLRTSSYIKLDSEGKALNNQTAVWSDTGNEADGTKWSCVFDDQGTTDTNDDLYWEVKTNNETADVRDKDITYKWGGLTAQGRELTSQNGTYEDDWNPLVNAANGVDDTSDTNNPLVYDPLCGYEDWRVPTVVELRTLADYTTYPAIDATMFPNNIVNYYWTSSAYNNSSNFAYALDMRGIDYPVSRSGSKALRLVRGGTALETDVYIPNVWQDSRYTVHSNSTVTDTETDLMWKRCPEGLSGESCADGTAGDYTNENAKKRAQIANEGQALQTIAIGAFQLIKNCRRFLN